MTDDQARETPLYSFMPTGSHELRVSVYPGSVEMHNDGRVIRKPIVEWMKDCVALSESVDTAHAHYQPQIDQCIKEINELRAACAEANEAYRRKTDYAESPNAGAGSNHQDCRLSREWVYGPCGRARAPGDHLHRVLCRARQGSEIGE
jgi:hypothetical protein